MKLHSFHFLIHLNIYFYGIFWRIHFLFSKCEIKDRQGNNKPTQRQFEVKFFKGKEVEKCNEIAHLRFRLACHGGKQEKDISRSSIHKLASLMTHLHLDLFEDTQIEIERAFRKLQSFYS